MAEWSPQRARGKRPLPLWADAFLRDTMELEGKEVGAYILILIAMWGRPSCDFPNDPRKLARISRVTLRTWNAKYSDTILQFFKADKNVIFSKRLRFEAVYVEKHVTHQRVKRTGENPDKYLKTIGVWKTGDTSVVKTPDKPTQQPNNLHKESILCDLNSEKLPLFAGQKKNDPADPFDEFWDECYPHRGEVKRGKQEARDQWDTVSKTHSTAILLDAARRYASWIKAELAKGVFVPEPPDPARWLRRERFNDDLGADPSSAEQQAKAQDARLSYLQKTADQMRRSGDNFVIGSRFVDDRDLHDIFTMGLAPDKLEKDC